MHVIPIQIILIVCLVPQLHVLMAQRCYLMANAQAVNYVKSYLLTVYVDQYHTMQVALIALVIGIARLSTLRLVNALIVDNARHQTYSRLHVCRN